ncbi:hypothetical protein [Actinomadura logoneensis]|uniref:hypothetical protein n=1 Tax=Actinomadura logoneensis TaxID=2293572 RepID=UPI0011C17E5F|nr:hypothetical protein [Actinomadura logoneensis]
MELARLLRFLTGAARGGRSAFFREELLTYFPELGENPLLVDEILGMAEYAVESGTTGTTVTCGGAGALTRVR